MLLKKAFIFAIIFVLGFLAYPLEKKFFNFFETEPEIKIIDEKTEITTATLTEQSVLNTEIYFQKKLFGIRRVNDGDIYFISKQLVLTDESELKLYVIKDSNISPNEDLVSKIPLKDLVVLRYAQKHFQNEGQNGSLKPSFHKVIQNKIKPVKMESRGQYFIAKIKEQYDYPAFCIADQYNHYYPTINIDLAENLDMTRYHENLAMNQYGGWLFVAKPF
jgi:hypothetical protein